MSARAPTTESKCGPPPASWRSAYIQGLGLLFRHRGLGGLLLLGSDGSALRRIGLLDSGGALGAAFGRFAEAIDVEREQRHEHDKNEKGPHLQLVRRCG